MRKVAAMAALAVAVTGVFGCTKKEEAKQPAAAPPSPAAPAGALAEKGAQVFKEKCAVCHKINGVGGSIGPDLSDTGKKHDAVFLQTQLQDPSAYKKDTKMPSFKDMPKEDKDALITYLLTLK